MKVKKILSRLNAVYNTIIWRSDMKRNIVFPGIIMITVLLIFGNDLLLGINQPDPIYYSVKREELLNTSEAGMKTFPIRWIVACAREDAPIYREPSLKRKIFNASFLQRFEVVKKIKDKLQVIEMGTQKRRPRTGWIYMKDLIYLPRSLKDPRTSVYQKVVFTHIEENLEANKIGDITFYKSSTPGKKNEFETRAMGTLRIAYVYAWENTDYEDSGFVLIGNFPTIEGLFSDQKAFEKIIYGWCKIDKLFPWNSRIALIPNRKENAISYIFISGPNLTNFYSQGKQGSVPDPGNLLTFDSNKMWEDSNWPFFLEGRLSAVNQEYVRLVCQVDANYANVSGLTVDQIKKEFEYLKARSKELDIVFLLDATKSMQPYIEAVAFIVQQVMDELKKNSSINQDNLRFGAAVYRDYEDGENKFEIQPLTKDVNRISNQLNQWAKRADSNPGDQGEAAYPEALFNGIHQAVQRSGYGEFNSKSLIVVGDAGNHSRGQDKHTRESIGHFLADQLINCIMVKVNHSEVGGETEKRAMELFRTDAENIRSNYINFYNKEGTKHNSTFLKKDVEQYFVLDLDNVVEPSILQEKLLKEHSKRISNSLDVIIDHYQRLIEGERIKTEETKGIVTDSVETISTGDGMYINPLVFESLKKRFGNDFDNVLGELRQKRAYLMKFGYAKEYDPQQKNIKQFNNVYLLRRNEIGKIIRDLDRTLEMLKPRKVKSLWKDLIERIYGEEYDPKRTFNEYAQMHDGITYKELSVLFGKTQEQLGRVDFHDFEKIEKKIIMVKARLEELYNDKSNSRLFGPEDDPYVWLYESEMP